MDSLTMRPKMGSIDTGGREEEAQEDCGVGVPVHSMDRGMNSAIHCRPRTPLARFLLVQSDEMHRTLELDISTRARR